ncbi:hypothetical protein CFT12S00416_05510 [Campylobacter fetus subsp. testudinum]|uniref:leucine-rich repeat protein n=1 Tax=Campylobacter fetus TaxID=196 RepID=UPI0008189FBD|nr:leucine-rich repeat protein [Campylobacter fetus]OCR88881.1 hypothetical protein CFT12S00416_05510 [Campylobacter fetus subsp. testudinum]
MKFQDALLSDKIFNFVDIPENAYKDSVPFSGKFNPQYVSSIGNSAFENNIFGNILLYFPYCKSIGKRAFFRPSCDRPPRLQFNDVYVIKEDAFYVDGYNKVWGHCDLRFGNVGTIEKGAFTMNYLNTKTDITFCDVNTIRTGAFVINMFTTDRDKGLRFKNVKYIQTGAFNGFQNSFHGVVAFENVENIADNAFSKQNFDTLVLPDKFKTRAELVRIGVGNPDVFKID